MRAIEFITESNQDELESQFEFNLDTDASRLEVYDMRGGPAGRIEFYNPNPDMPKQIGIDMIYVLPRYQRQGLGTAMFKYLTNRGFNILKPTELTPAGQEFFKNIKFKKQGVMEGSEDQDYLSQIPYLNWKPVNRSVWNSIQDEGLDEEQDTPSRSDWVMAPLKISPKDEQALRAFEDDAIEKFNRFDIHLKSRYPGLTDLIDYDNGTVTIVKTVNHQSISEDQSIDNITIQNTVDDSFRGGYHGTLIARTPEQQIGYLQYSMYQGMPKISMIYVVPEFRRHRIANRLLKALQELAPDEEIDWGYTTNDGSALKRSIDFIRKPNPEIIKKKQKLAGVRSKLAQLNHKLEQLQATDIELARRYVKTVGDRWNKLNDLEYRLENELSVAKGEYSKLIPEDELEEGFKQTLANLGFAAAVGAGAVGGGAIKDKVSQFMNPPAATAQQTQQAPKAVQPAAPVAKKPVAPQITKINPITASPLEKKLILGAKQAGLKGVELAQFLAQCAHETMDYRRMIERGGKNYFNKYERKFAPKKAKILGNVKTGDGVRYKGRGYIQLTGRDNYMRAGRALGIDLINKPDLAADPDIAIKIALWYWNTRVKPDVTDFSNTTEVTREINPGLHGLQQRHQNFVEYINQAQKTEPNPG